MLLPLIRESGLIAAITVLLQATAGAGETQTDDGDEATVPTAADSIVADAVDETLPQSIDEVVVYGDKPLFALRREVYESEENFWGVFSALNPDDEFDVRCYYEVPSFTHIRRHVCRAQFVIDATNAEARSVFSEQVGRFSRPATMEINRKKKELQALMEKMIAEHPELLQALEKYTNAQGILESEKNRRYGGNQE